MQVTQPQSIQPNTSLVHGLPTDRSVSCGHCGENCNASELLPFGRIQICCQCKNILCQSIKEGVPLGVDRAWKKHRRVILLTEHTELPKRCICCNQPGNKRQTRTLDYYTPTTTWICVVLFFVINLFVFIPALLLRKKIELEYYYCDRHAKLKRCTKRTGFSLIGLAFVLVIFFKFFSAHFLILPIIGLLFAGLLALHWSTHGLRVVKCDDRIVKLDGLKRPFLNSLSQWRL